MHIVLYYTHHTANSGGLVNYFVHGAARAAGRRFIRLLPLPVIIILSAVAIFLYAGSWLRRRIPMRKR